MTLINVLKKYINAVTQKTNFEATDYLIGYNTANPTQIKRYPQSAFAASIGLDVLKLFVQKTVGSTGADYTSLQDAFNAGYNVVKVITNISLTADITHSNRVIFIDNSLGITVNCGNYKFTGINNRYIAYSGYRSYSGTSLPSFIFSPSDNGTACISQSEITGINLNFTGTTGKVTPSLGRLFECNIYNSYIDLPNLTLSRIIGNRTNIWNSTINGGGTSTYGYTCTGTGTIVNFYNCHFKGIYDPVSGSSWAEKTNLFQCSTDTTGINSFSVNTGLGECRNFLGTVKFLGGKFFNCIIEPFYATAQISNVYFENCTGILSISPTATYGVDSKNCAFTLGSNWSSNSVYFKMKGGTLTTGVYVFQNSNNEFDKVTITGNLNVTGSNLTIKGRTAISGTLIITGNNWQILEQTSVGSTSSITGNKGSCYSGQFTGLVTLQSGSQYNTFFGGYFTSGYTDNSGNATNVFFALKPK